MRKKFDIKSFDQDLYNEIRDKLIPLNEERLKIRIFRINTVIFFFLFFLASFVLSIPDGMTPIGVVIIIASGILYSIYIVKGVKKEWKFKKKYKNSINNIVFTHYLNNYKYSPNKGVSFDYIANTKSINMGNRFHSEDAITGKYNEINFIRSDVLIQEESTDSDGDTSVTTLFEGQWMNFDFPKTFKSNIQVYSVGFRNVRKNKKSFLSKHFKKEEYEEKRVLVLTENEEFNKKFKIYSSNEHDAYYVLTPHLLEAIEKIKKDINCPIMLLFTDNTLDVALSTRKDSLEPSYKKDIDDAIIASLSDAINQMETIIKFIDYLKLDNDLFVTKKSSTNSIKKRQAKVLTNSYDYDLFV